VSLRARLVLGMALVAGVLVVTAFVITRTTRDNLMAQVDRRLETVDERARRVGGPFGGRFPGRYPGGFPGGAQQVSEDPNASDAFVARLLPNGTLLPLAEPDDAARPTIRRAQLRNPGREPFTVGSADEGLRYRVRVDDTDDVTTVVALPLSDVDAAVRRLVRVELVVTAAILGLLALVTSWVLRLGVRPVKTMTATATAIAAGDLTQRVPHVAPGTEAGELGLALNQMMGRIEEAFGERTRSEHRLRRFAADASHELRTPVATVRGYAELYRAGGLRDEQALAEAMRRTEQEAVRMGDLIEDLLLLARMDQGRPLEQAPVDLAALARDGVADARVVHPERELALDAPDAVVVAGDEGRLRQVVANLVGNAVVHTPPSAPIRVVVRRDGPDAVLEVIDGGPGMTAEQAEQAFERFYRADPSRSRHQGGSGLGLSIVDAIATASGGRAELQSAPGQGTTVRVVLPAT
jgi:two-component system OmpR family sensor kinase